MIEKELAWAAGFFDGEGSSKKVNYHYKTKKGEVRKPSQNICLSVAQCERLPLERFQQAVGGLGRINGPYQYNTNRRPYWVWSASTRAARIVFGYLERYLCPIKKKQYIQITNELDSTKSRKKGWIYDGQ